MPSIARTRRRDNMDLRGKKVVLVGGAGLIGSHTADHLVRQDVKEIVIYDNFARGRIENLSDSMTWAVTSSSPTS
jgi:UDP-glucose 4-epimerase